jgi:hypothetical protein
MSSATIVSRHGNWTLKRWSYEGAPLFAEHARGVTVEVDGEGDFAVDGLDDSTSSFHVPRIILEKLLADARARGVIRTDGPIPLN